MVKKGKEKYEKEEEVNGVKLVQKNKKRFKKYMIKEKRIMENRESDEEMN